MTDLASTAKFLFEQGKGLLAADESVHTATTRLASYGVEAGEEMRRQYRELFLNAPGVENHLSGVILFSETLLQKGDDGKLFVDSLEGRGIVPGVKVDLGTEALPESSDELITQGLLDLSERLAEHKKQGARFTKWRAVIRIDGDRLPSGSALHENAKRLAAYAKEVQTQGLVPILEPEVLREGKHSRQRSGAVLRETLRTLFSVLAEQSVDHGGLVLKTSMAIAGSESARKDTSEEVAEETMAALMETVPKDVAGIVFLSGGQTPDEATDNLAAIVRCAQQARAPWPLTFSYARALQEEALAIWKGKEENVPAAREAFLARLKKVSAALG